MIHKQGTPSTLVTRVINDQGTAFNVVLVRPGDCYGLNGVIVNASNDAMIEFYDAAYENDARFNKSRGQFVTRYYLRTLIEASAHPHGLDLCGGAPQWKVTGQNVRDAITAVEGALLESPQPAKGSP